MVDFVGVSVSDSMAELLSAPMELRRCLDVLEEKGRQVDAVTYTRLLRECGDAKLLPEARRLHLNISRRGVEEEVLLGHEIVRMYLNCGGIREAQAVFSKIPIKSVVLWTEMVAALSQESRFPTAFQMFYAMHLEGLAIDRVTFLTVLKACTRAGALREGKVVHMQIQESGLEEDVVIGTAVINMYSCCNSLEDAFTTFKRLNTRNVVSWTVMIAAHARKGHYQEVLKLLRHMQQEGFSPNEVTLLNSLAACSSPETFHHGRMLHHLVTESGFGGDALVANALVSMYSRCGSLEDALGVFAQMQHRDVFSWTAITAGYVQAGLYSDAIELFQKMQLEGLKPDKVTFITILSAKLYRLTWALYLHGLIIEAGFESDVGIGTALIETFNTCGDLTSAVTAFARISHHSVVSWSSLVGAYVEHGLWKDALAVFQQMLLQGVRPDKVALIGILKGCRSLVTGRLIHSLITMSGLEQDLVVSNSLIKMYGACGDLMSARRIFDRVILEYQDVVSWNSMITGYAEFGCYKEADLLFNTMSLEGVLPDRITFTTILRASTHLSLKNLDKVGTAMAASGLGEILEVHVLLLRFYVDCGLWDKAFQLWDRMDREQVLCWNALLSALADHGKGREALQIFRHMQFEGVRPDNMTIVSVFSACSKEGFKVVGQETYDQLTGHELEVDEQVGASAIRMFGKLGELKYAEQVIGKFKRQTPMLCAAAAEACADCGFYEEALDLIQQMQLEGLRPDESVLANILASCGNKETMPLAKLIHAEAVMNDGCNSDAVTGTSLMNMYASCGSLQDVRRLFDDLTEKDVISWTAVITAHVRHDEFQEAVMIFKRMLLDGLEVDNVTFIAVLTACGSLPSLGDGKLVHKCIMEKGTLDRTDVAVGNALITMYGKCGLVQEARDIFDRMQTRDVVSWNALLASHNQQGLSRKAFVVFEQMLLEGVKPNRFTFVITLSICANLAAMEESKQIGEFVMESGLETDDVVKNAFLNFYGRCGKLEQAVKLFSEIEQKEVAWNSMIASYAHNGSAAQAFDLLAEMVQNGTTLDNLTFVNIFSACSHAGKVADGIAFFSSMITDHNMQATPEHYGCMVDIYGRSGRLLEAEALLDRLPKEKASLIPWMIMLGACRVHNDLQRGKFAAEKIISMEPGNAAAHVVLSNIYAEAKQWEEVARIRKLMVDNKVKKEPGISCIKVNKVVHEFVAKDRTHPQTEEIYAEVARLMEAIKKVGYVPDTKLVLHDVEEEHKEQLLCCHSEKLAIAFGMLYGKPDEPLTILKNLRVCGDCHSATKFISMVTKREIIVRDARRFHHFRSGKCTCGDYW